MARSRKFYRAGLSDHDEVLVTEGWFDSRSQARTIGWHCTEETALEVLRDRLANEAAMAERRLNAIKGQLARVRAKIREANPPKEPA